MMRFVTPVISLALLAALAASSALAQTAAPAPTGPLANALGYFVGTWNCKGGPTSMKSRGATVAYEWELGNTMVEDQVDVPATGKLPAYRAASYSAYDAKKKRVVVSGNTMYGEWSAAWTAGWNGTKLTWHDVATADGKLGRDVITRNSATSFDDIGYDSHGKVDFKAHCDKAPAPAEK
jgi:hypothetical protein